jgi:hypothetical protein
LTPNFYHDQQRNLLIYPRVSDNIERYIPEARQINGSYVAVPRTLHTSQILSYLRYPVAPVITEATYDFPIEPGRKPLFHQKVYANFAALNPRMFNLGDPGTMKTLSTLWAADWLMRQHPAGTFRALIVAPLTILETVWAAAIFRNFLGRRSIEVLQGDAAKRRKLLAKKADFSIINFDGVGIGAHTRKKFELDGLSKDILEDEDIKLVIVDEASAYRDASTKRHRIARLVIGKRPYLFMLTGTPLPNAPTDGYGLAKLMNNAFGKSFDTFQKETMWKQSMYKWLPQKDGYEKARRLLVPAVRFSIDEIWDAPPSTTQRRRVELTTEQKAHMASLKRDLVIAVKNGTQIDAANEAAARQKFLQISLGSIYDADHVPHHIDASPRYSEVADIIESTSRKVVIFVPLTSVINKLYKELSATWRCGIINGDVKAKDRPALIQAFASEPDFKAIIVDPGSTAHGINEFVCADTVVWFGATDKNELYIQGNARVQRPGQTHPTTIFQIVSNALEGEIFNRLETQTSMQGLMLQAVRNGDL